MGSFINISNHPSKGWTAEQQRAARALCFEEEIDDTDDEGYLPPAIFDLQFPDVPPTAGPDQISDLVEATLAAIPLLSDVDAVMVQGEMTLTFALVTRLHELGFLVVAATTERVSVENADGTKTSSFRFRQFRSYRPGRTAAERASDGAAAAAVWG